jgi:hypothetical protein
MNKESTIQLKKQLDELRKQLELETLKSQLLVNELTEMKYHKNYDEIEKKEHVYILKTDGGYKVGKTKNIHQRVTGLQTGNANDIVTILDYKTANALLLENNVHYILARYRKNKREFFEASIEHIENTIKITGICLDTLKSTYDNITTRETIKKLIDKFKDEFGEDILEEEEVDKNIKTILLNNFEEGTLDDFVRVRYIKNLFKSNGIKATDEFIKCSVSSIFKNIKHHDRKYLDESKLRNVFIYLKIKQK